MADGSRHSSPELQLAADVLVIGGGPAGTWAALAAREQGAKVILVDKGWCGASGVGAAATIGHWWVAPEGRAAAMAAKAVDACGLADETWMERVLAETWASWPGFAESRGYVGDPTYRSGRGGQVVVQGPVYLREMRRLVLRAGVTILDHAPAVSLLMDAAGRCAGAEGVLRQKDQRWRIDARAVVLAAGGSALRSGCIGSSVNTGDALLMAAELGAEWSGMEFSNYYGIVPKGGSVDKNGYLLQAAFFDAAGHQVHLGWSSPYGVMGTAAAPLFGHEPVFCQFTQVPEANRPFLRAGQPNLFTQFDRLGVDPFTQKFEVEPMFEGSVRGSGGIVVKGPDCASSVPGLWVAGDAASREMLVGASSGAGAVNAAWTLASGRWAGAGAARSARALAPGRGGAGARAPVGAPDRGGAAAAAGASGRGPADRSQRLSHRPDADRDARSDRGARRRVAVRPARRGCAQRAVCPGVVGDAVPCPDRSHRRPCQTGKPGDAPAHGSSGNVIGQLAKAACGDGG
ncbi:FAD-binding protein [Sinirhodobacter hankyongi]|uniref:FAD-binding protein n=1 Tax=Paenirhodobacter hankyongi TaxID=2294033 RepID=A0A421BSI6_9RHOB|nr:FAD-binding protein [Sinirhodobacter hankyongi]RLL71249.1 FAD-binding protein [Sinirhodobacter hankyongi]